ncbi:MAG: PEP-CTERM sorting domain-containing protein [Kiritimatiellae bacterium]|nr:PEP-CTERM sorting domain-containing protein [Kiritimatiellia bacterium]
MKKIVVVLALALTAFAANAASVKWNAANIYGSDGTSKFTGDVTLLCVQLSDFSSTVTASSTGAIAATTVALPDATAGTYLDFYITFTDNGKTFTSETKHIAIPTTATPATANFGNMTSQTQNASNWGGGVPEPSSALLLLMGGAMLALRRKQK